MHRPTNPLPVFIQGGEPRTRFHGWRGNPSPDGCLPEGGRAATTTWFFHTLRGLSFHTDSKWRARNRGRFSAKYLRYYDGETIARMIHMV